VDRLREATKLKRRYSYDKALAVLDELFAAPEGRDMKEWQRAQALTQRAEVLYYRRQFDKALQDARKALELDPQFGEAQLVVARVLMEQVKFQAAVDACDEALKVDASLFQAYTMRARARVGLAQFREALADARKAAEKQPDLPAAYLALGYVHHARKEYDKA